jgi:tetratricopeptide (TPR) repeat protein
MAKKRKVSKGKAGRPKRAPKPPPVDLPDPRVIEALMRQAVGRSEQPGADTPAERAQDLVYEASEESDADRRGELAREALALWPDCADAYVLLAEDARNEREALGLYEQGVAAGERALGPETFRDEAGRFWLLLETRPYMRARFGLADVLWALGRRDEAVGHLQEMLRLNPNDNQGARYTLLGWLLNLGRHDDVQALLDRYDDDGSAAWAYTRALSAFDRHGDTPAARKLLARAIKVNKHVAPFLLEEKRLPVDQPGYYSPGDPSEAALYAASALGGWKTTPAATAWLREATAAKKRGKRPAARGPLSQSKEGLRRLPQHEDVWQAEVRPFVDWILERGRRVRPWVALVVSRTEDLVLAHAIRSEGPSAAALWDLLVAAAQEPAVGEPHRPAVLQVRPDDRWQQLQPHLEAAGIRCEFAGDLDVADAALGSLFAHLGADREPGLLAVPGLTPRRVRGFYEAAADYYRAAPWRPLSYDATLKVESDQFPGGPWYAVVMGQSGMTFGLALYEDLDFLRRLRGGGLSDEEGALDTVGLTVTFDEQTYLPVADLDAVEQLRLPVAGPQAYPTAFRKERGMSMRPPQPWELQLLEACLRAIPNLVRRRPDGPAREVVTVPTADGQTRLTVSWVEGE